MDKTKFRPIGVENDKADNSVIAPVESGTTASQAYAIGEHFIRDSAFCTAKIAIAQGEAFTLNTNYTAGDIGSVINGATNLANANSAYVTNNYMYVTRIGNLVNVSGRFHVNVEKPTGQQNYLFSNLPPVLSGAIIAYYDANKLNFLIANDKLTSNDAIPVGNYNLQFTYVTKF